MLEDQRIPELRLKQYVEGPLSVQTKDIGSVRLCRDGFVNGGRCAQMVRGPLSVFCGFKNRIMGCERGSKCINSKLHLREFRRLNRPLGRTMH